MDLLGVGSPPGAGTKDGDMMGNDGRNFAAGAIACIRRPLAQYGQRRSDRGRNGVHHAEARASVFIESSFRSSGLHAGAHRMKPGKSPGKDDKCILFQVRHGSTRMPAEVAFAHIRQERHKHPENPLRAHGLQPHCLNRDGIFR